MSDFIVGEKDILIPYKTNLNLGDRAYFNFTRDKNPAKIGHWVRKDIFRIGLNDRRNEIVKF